MTGKDGITYRDAGVDLDAAERAKEGLKELVARTRDENTLSEMGLFGGLYAVPEGVPRPVLVTSADGVGTKLKVAFLAGRHDTVGQDLVNHCVNDILVQGARPLFFLDYLATGQMEEGVVADVVRGVAEACIQNRCALLGGETAEMPGFYAPGEYDLAGFIVGLVERDKILDGSAVRSGDVLVALGSSGLHTNGYTLARKIVFDRMGLGVDDPFPEAVESGPVGKGGRGPGGTGPGGKGGADPRNPGGAGAMSEAGTGSVGDVLLRVHRSYLSALTPVLDDGRVRALAHITGGGIPGNVPRVLPPGLGAVVDRSTWEPPPVFRVLQREGAVDREEMFRAFNMGVGMVALVAPDRADSLVEELVDRGEDAWIAGRVEEGSGVRFEDGSGS